MWTDELEPNTSWASLWYGHVLCGCRGIRRLDAPCPVCGAAIPSHEPTRVHTEGRGEIFVSATYAGGEGRYEDYVYLRLLHREWRRNVSADEMDSAYEGVSPRAAIVLLFWTYFETRIERLLRMGLRGTPEAVAEDALRRYQFIGARLESFYKVLFGATYFDDLRRLQFGDVATHLAEVRRRRNEFAHGKPSAINDALVYRVVEMLKREHESWIAVFNSRLRAD